MQDIIGEFDVVKMVYATDTDIPKTSIVYDINKNSDYLFYIVDYLLCELQSPSVTGLLIIPFEQYMWENYVNTLQQTDNLTCKVYPNDTYEDEHLVFIEFSNNMNKSSEHSDCVVGRFFALSKKQVHIEMFKFMLG